jgi:DNA-binding GntR family transcriptional regulator
MKDTPERAAANVTPAANYAAVSTTQRVANELRDQIIQGKFTPGEKLKVETLKTLLQTGTSPIREALSLLTSDHLVERIDQRGFRVAPASEKHFREILMLRCELENLALRQSLDHGDTEWEEHLVLTHHRLSKSTRTDVDAWEFLHKDFHKALISASDSPILLRFCNQLYDLNIRYRYIAGKSTRYAKRNVATEHKQILEASIARDADAACRLLTRHYELTGDFLADKIGMLYD